MSLQTVIARALHENGMECAAWEPGGPDIHSQDAADIVRSIAADPEMVEVLYNVLRAWLDHEGSVTLMDDAAFFVRALTSESE